MAFGLHSVVHHVECITTNEPLGFVIPPCQCDVGRIFGDVSEESVTITLAATSNMVHWSGIMPLHKQYKMKFEQLRYWRLKCTLYSDTFSSNVTLTRGITRPKGLFVVMTST